ncbi:MAG: hypothetical protein D6770_03405, partial [Anaerolineae bacterium]
MPDLLHALQGHDFGYLRIVAELWGVELDATEEDTARRELAASLLDADLVSEIVETLPDEARTALRDLVAGEGRVPWATFVRRFGEVREMGPGRRDREKPHHAPASITEVLFYRALVARAFFDASGGPQEFAYIADDLLPLVAAALGARDGEDVSPEPFGRPASPRDRAHIFPADDTILDDACTLLAALRMGREGLSPHATRVPETVLRDLLTAAGLLDEDGTPRPEAVRLFLEAPRHEALSSLVTAWHASRTFNELRHVPGLVCEGEWANDPLSTRQILLRFLESVPRGEWWDLRSFVASVRERYPDFQRPAGDYDSWFVRRVVDGEYLRGFEHWDEVDGALIRYVITGPMHWLGLTDLATGEEGESPAAFRLTFDPASLRSGEFAFPVTAQESPIRLTSRGRIEVPRLASRAARYQIARFCEWDASKGEMYAYHVTPRSLARAARQGLKVVHLLAVLKQHTAAPLPPTFVRALKRWEAKGTEAR